MPPTRILIVEDELIVADDLQRRLERLGYEVVAAVDTGEEAVRQAEHLQPDIVLMDIRLQGDLDGIAAAGLIRERLGLPVVYLTAHADESTLQRAKLTEPFGYVLKPFEERELRTVLEMGLYKHHAERKLRESEQRYATTLSSIGDGVIATDRQGRVTFLNPVAETLTGWTLRDAFERPLTEVFVIINEHTHEPVDNPVERVLREGVILGLANSTILIARNGKEFPIDDCASPIRTDRGQVVGAVLVFRDVTEKRAAETERARLEDQLRQAQKMEAIGQLAGGIAHDFNNLLTVINGYAHLLLETLGEDSSWRGMIEGIYEAGERAADLTRQLLAFSRKQMLQPRVLDLNQLLQGMEKLLRRLLPEPIALSLHLDPELYPIRADPGQLERVVLNLATNARDAMPQGGQLRMTTSSVLLDEAQARAFPEGRPGPHSVLTIEDTGQGMDEQTRLRIFEPFFTTKEVGKGTGLGLASVYGIIKQSQGHIEVASVPGQGTRFRILLPCVAEPLAPAVPPHLSGLPTGTETVLLVEDEESVRSFSSAILRQTGYTVLEARHGVEAIELAQGYTSPIHLLITDVVMPQMSGPTLAELLLRARPDLKVLFVSGYPAEELGMQTGEQPPLLPKPFTAALLARMVRELLS